MRSRSLTSINSLPENAGQFPEYLSLEEILLLAFGDGEVLGNHIQ